MRNMILVGLLFVSSILASVDTAYFRSDIRLYPFGKSSISNKSGIGWIDTMTLPIVSIGPGIQTVAINLGSGSIGVFDMLTPVNISLNLLQRVYIQPGRDPFIFCLFAPALGFLITKHTDSQGVIFGINLTAYAVKINGFTLGIGIAWVNDSKMIASRDNVFITIPLTYTIDIGK